MKVLFLSPGFPPTAPSFCAALGNEGVTVIGIGDEQLTVERQQAAKLAHYAYEPHMGDHPELLRAAKALSAELGPFDRVEHDGEHWLEPAARLRDELGIPGLSAARLAPQRSKLGMAEIFGRAGIQYPPSVSAKEPTEVRRLGDRCGYPLVFKPDVSSGALSTFTVGSEAELSVALSSEPEGHIVQPFISGQIVTFDGLVDITGRILFWTSHAYDTGIMQVRRGQLDGYYYSLRELPPGLEDLGRRAVAAFDVRERFFHLEFFAHEDGSFTALEMNLRLPGGFTPDLMNAACEIDLYALWAAMLAGRDLGEFRFERRYHTAHAGRRAGRAYRLDTATLLRELGDTLLMERPISPHFAATMGDMAYLLKHRELSELRRAIGLVQAV